MVRATLIDKLCTIPWVSTPLGLAQATVWLGKLLVVNPAKHCVRNLHLTLLDKQEKTAYDKLINGPKLDKDDLLKVTHRIKEIRIKKEKLVAHLSFANEQKETAKKIGHSLLRAVPVIGNLDALDVCIRSDEPVRKATAADRASLFPIVQQVVGICTIGSNLFKCVVSDPIEAIIRNQRISEKETEFKNIIILMKEKQAELSDDDRQRYNDRLNTLGHDLQVLYNEGKFLEHAEYIGIGILRTLPFVALIYSAVVMERDIKAEAEKNEARRTRFMVEKEKKKHQLNELKTKLNEKTEEPKRVPSKNTKDRKTRRRARKIAVQACQQVESRRTNRRHIA